MHNEALHRRPGRVLAARAAVLLAALAFLVLLAGHASAGSASRFVTKTADTADGACDGDCSFREALLAAQPGDTIAFVIAGDGPHVIQPMTQLPAVGPNVMINGYAQPGSEENTAAAWEPSNAVINVVLDGSLAAGDAAGLWIAGEGVTIRGLAIGNFNQEGIFVSTFASAVIRGNYIGLAPDGETATPNAGAGIRSYSGKPGNAIGGPSPANRNVISGNGLDGIIVTGGAPHSVTGNFAGTNAAGTAAVPNGGAGVNLAAGPGSFLGGNTAGSGNLLSGNSGAGAALSSQDAFAINVKGNRIGVAADGVTPLPNGGDGVFLDGGAHDNTIGGEAASNQNVIAHNTGAGVALTAAAGANNYIDPNITHSNGGLGTDLLIDGVTPNDDGAMDGDSGPNDLVNFPVITSALISGNSITIAGTLDSEPSHGFNLFFFANDACDLSGYGEGQRFLGPTFVQTGPDGLGEFSQLLPETVTSGQFITASSSNPESTSEFSLCFEATLAGGMSVIWGDLLCSGEPGSLSALAVLLHISHLPEPEGAPGCPNLGDQIDVAGASPHLWGDINCDGVIGSTDALRILLDVAHLPVAAVPGCPQPGDQVVLT